jgi:predicted amidohydrolase YtcJ
MAADGSLFEGGSIRTLDPRIPRGEALAVQGERIVAVGGRSELREAFPGFVRVGLEGRTVLPAFTDSHIHFAAVGLALRRVNLRSCRSLRDAVDLVAAGRMDPLRPVGQEPVGGGPVSAAG